MRSAQSEVCKLSGLSGLLIRRALVVSHVVHQCCYSVQSAGAGLHVWTDVSSREFSHSSSPRRVLHA